MTVANISVWSRSSVYPPSKQRKGPFEVVNIEDETCCQCQAQQCFSWRYFCENALVNASLYPLLDINMTLQRKYRFLSDSCNDISVGKQFKKQPNSFPPVSAGKLTYNHLLHFPPLCSAHLPFPISGSQAVSAQTKLFSCHGYRYRKVTLLTFSGGGGFKWWVALRRPFRETPPEQQGAGREDGEEQEKVRAAY